MSDFFIDFREKTNRNLSKAVYLMKYFEKITVKVFDYERFTVLLSRADDWNIWGPYEATNKKVFVALCGRIALESEEWEKTSHIEGEGGLACKAIYSMYKKDGVDTLKNLNGNYVVLVYDANIQKFYIVTDRCGMLLCFKAETGSGDMVLCSHQDILAEVTEASGNWDFTSFAEFLITGKVSFPHTYYHKIKALDYGSIHDINLSSPHAIYESSKKYFDFNFKIDNHVSEQDLAQELAESFKKAVNRRTLPIFGQTAISLSGGLDSRTILCSAKTRDGIKAFCFYDEENLEYRIAKDIAKEAHVELVPLKREFDYYGDNAEMGTKISGGMGDFGSNHYLGFRSSLQNLGAENIIAGFYCDYLFKGLVLDKKIATLSRNEVLSDFQYESYMRHYWFNTPYADYVQERLDRLFPEDLRKDKSEIACLRIQQKRIFPLYYEPDNQETVVPQRVFGWYLPIVDNDIIDTYLKIPPDYKLNASLFSRMAALQCGEKISKITNINTGARVDASLASLIFHRYKSSIQRRLKKRRKSIATDESWPNWTYYIHNSSKIESMWKQESVPVADVFHEITGKDPFKENLRNYRIKQVLRFLTLKLWIDQHV